MTDFNFQIGDKFFEWDSEKAKKNKIKHGVSFKVAAKVFEDENRIERPDYKHSQDEERWQVIGKVDEVLFVVYTERGNITRLISAREADDTEKEIYYGDSDLYFT